MYTFLWRLNLKIKNKGNFSNLVTVSFREKQPMVLDAKGNIRDDYERHQLDPALGTTVN